MKILQELGFPVSFEGRDFGEGLASLLDKIKAMLSPRALRYFSKLDETLLVKTPILNDYAVHDKTIRLLTRAIQESIVVNMRYRSLSCSEPYDTLYRPYGLVFFDSDLYCIGMMDRYNEIRTLKLSRIVSAELTDTPFRRPQVLSPKSLIEELQNETKMMVAVYATAKNLKGDKLGHE